MDRNDLSNDEIKKNKTKNWAKIAKTSQNIEKDITYRTSNSFHMYPNLHHSTNSNSFRTKFYLNLKRKLPIMNQKDFDPNYLKKELSLYKLDMHAKKKDLVKLKIKYNKLEDENFMNKNLISNILGISFDKKNLTKEAVSDKIENCKLSVDNREKLQEAYTKILIKLEIDEKKTRINRQINYIEE